MDRFDGLAISIHVSERDGDLHLKALGATELIQVDLLEVGDDLLILCGLLA